MLRHGGACPETHDDILMLLRPVCGRPSRVLTCRPVVLDNELLAGTGYKWRLAQHGLEQLGRRRVVSGVGDAPIAILVEHQHPLRTGEVDALQRGEVHKALLPVWQDADSYFALVGDRRQGQLVLRYRVRNPRHNPIPRRRSCHGDKLPTTT